MKNNSTSIVRFGEFKHLDTSRQMKVYFQDDSGNWIVPDDHHKFVVKVSSNSDYLGVYPAEATDNYFLIATKYLALLDPGIYKGEIWETFENADGTEQTAIYPYNDSFFNFVVEKNVQDGQNNLVRQLDIQDVINEAVISAGQNLQIAGINLLPTGTKASVDQEYRDGKNVLTFNIPVPDKGKSAYQSWLDTGHQGAEEDFVNWLRDTSMLFAYAKKSDLPQISYNPANRVLTLNEQHIKIPATIDLTGYVTWAAMGTRDYQNSKQVNALIERYLTTHELSNGHSIEPDTSMLQGKTWVAIGDSITEENRFANKGYVKQIAEATGVNAINVGKAMTTWVDHVNFDIDKQADLGGLKPDFITVMLGVNDYIGTTTNGKKLGNVGDSTEDTVLGCVYLCLQRWQEKYYATPIGVITPLQSMYGYNPGRGGFRLEELVEGIKTIAHSMGIPVLDLYHQSNLNPRIPNVVQNIYHSDQGGQLSTSTQADGLHPNTYGHSIIATKVKHFIINQLLFENKAEFDPYAKQS